jgi:hypothetical protein
MLYTPPANGVYSHAFAGGTTESRSLVPRAAEHTERQFRLFVAVDQEPACPVCGQVSRSRRSCYCQLLQDLPWQCLSVLLYVFTHPYRCRNSNCPRRIFCQRLPGVARAYARQTDRPSEIIRIVGYIAGASPGQRLLLRLAIETSDNTALRRVKHPPVEPVESNTIKALGC